MFEAVLLAVLDMLGQTLLKEGPMAVFTLKERFFLVEFIDFFVECLYLIVLPGLR
jgi:hypothetical protein